MTQHQLVRTVVLSAATAAALFCGVGGAADAPAPQDKPTIESKLARKGYTLGKSVKSIADYRVDGFQYIDAQHVLFNDDPGRAYLLTLRGTCSDLANSQSIAFTSDNSRLSTLDSVITPRLGSDVPRHCPIETINELSKIPKKS